MRIVCWFSCGAASAVATKLAIAENAGKLPLIIAYTEVLEEHPDNKRFLAECEKWFGQEIQILKNEKYQGSIFNVFEKSRYIVGVAGAPCTRLLKKEVRQKFEQTTDRQVFGYTAEEQHRLDRFIDANNDVDIWTPLIDKGLSKEDCLAMLQNANIELPAMYRLGYHNNNCIGCVKGGAGYWNKIRVDFPDHFERMAKLERSIGATISKSKGERVYLDELPVDVGDYPTEQNIECSIFCHMAQEDYK
jgi:3'-phosphoadenosine 5'-phosphosulfate sulfotransferase (PAPS reductase)/FAD synthetase